MPIYTPYFVFLGISALSFIIAFIVKVFTKQRPRTSDTLIWVVMGTVIVYYLVRLIFGWRLSNWYVEAILVLGVCIALDIFILIKYRYSQQVRIVYYCIRMTGVIVPIILFVMAVGVTLVSLGFSKGVACYVVPVDTTYGEQWVYKNLYVYKGECNLGSQIVFKKKFLFFEKEVASISVPSTFRSLLDFKGPITGFLSKNGDIIYLSDEKYSSGPPQKKYRYIKISILKPNYLKVELIMYLDYINAEERREEEESSQVQYIKL